MLHLNAVVVTHNHAAYLSRCLESLLPEVRRYRGAVQVIDNRSDDASADIARSFPEVRLHVNKERRGYAANANYGMALVDSRYYFLINPDTEVLPGAVGKLLSFMEEQPQVGLCGGQLVYADGTSQFSPRRFPTLGTFIARRTPIRALLRDSRWNQHHLMRDADHTAPMEVDWLLGACLLARREAVEDVGPLDEGFFLYVEDIDWARRMHKAGWAVCYVPAARIVHHHLAVSDNRLLSRHMLMHLGSMARYARKYMLPAIPGISIARSEVHVWTQTRERERLGGYPSSCSGTGDVQS